MKRGTRHPELPHAEHTRRMLIEGSTHTKSDDASVIQLLGVQTGVSIE